MGASRKKKKKKNIYIYIYIYIYIIRIAAMASSSLSGIRANLVITISARCQTGHDKNVKEMCKNERKHSGTEPNDESAKKATVLIH